MSRDEACRMGWFLGLGSDGNDAGLSGIHKKRRGAGGSELPSDLAVEAHSTMLYRTKLHFFTI